MEQVIDAIITELTDLIQTEEFLDIMEIVDIHFDDPLMVNIEEYPYIYVAPVADSPKEETMGRAGYDRRTLQVQVGLVTNASDFFDSSVRERPASRKVIQAMALIRARLRRLSKRGLGLTDVNNVVVQATNYLPVMREDSLLKAALTTLVVDRQYQHEE